MPVATYRVPDISCEGCANAIKRALSTMDGIRSIDVNVDTKIVRVEYDSDMGAPDTIQECIGEAGYDMMDAATEQTSS